MPETKTPKQQVAEILEGARAEAISIKAACYCHALSQDARPCISCTASDLILRLCNALEAADKGFDNVLEIVKNFNKSFRAIS